MTLSLRKLVAAFAIASLLFVEIYAAPAKVHLDLSANGIDSEKGPSVGGVATVTRTAKEILSSGDDCFLPALMAPLEIGTITNNYDQLLKDLQTLKNNDVASVTTDVWWGEVQKNGPDSFDFGPYVDFARAMKQIGLLWVPIMSTHQCGGNVGDTCNYPIPSFAFEPKQGESADDVNNNRFFGYRSGQDHKGSVQFITESLAPWYKDALPLYKKFYEKFAEEFANYNDIIPEVYLSMGPAGELRYPSYNKKTSWEYPGVGYIMAYSSGAIRSFQNYSRVYYNNDIQALNKDLEIVTPYTSFDQVLPPGNDILFLTTKCSGNPCWQTKYGNFFFLWYQNVLVQHVHDITAVGREGLSKLSNIKLMGKIAGIHWQYNQNGGPLAAMAAGYYYKNYAPIVEAFRIEGLKLTFTCLEMKNNPTWGDDLPDSKPEELVKEVASTCNSKNVPVSGENALEPNMNYEGSYQTIQKSLTEFKFDGFTFLRWSTLLNSNQNQNWWKQYVTSVGNICPTPSVAKAA